MCVLSGDKKRKACCLLRECVGLRSERADAGTWGRNGCTGSRHTEMVNVMPGMHAEMPALFIGSFMSSSLLSPLLAHR